MEKGVNGSRIVVSVYDRWLSGGQLSVDDRLMRFIVRWSHCWHDASVLHFWWLVGVDRLKFFVVHTRKPVCVLTTANLPVVSQNSQRTYLQCYMVRASKKSK